MLYWADSLRRQTSVKSSNNKSAPQTIVRWDKSQQAVNMAQISSAKWCHGTTTECTWAESRPHANVSRPSARPRPLIKRLLRGSCRLCFHFVSVAVLVIPAKIKPRCFDFLCELFYFPFKVFALAGRSQRRTVRLCVCVCSASLHPAHFSVPASHCGFWWVCAFPPLVFSRPSCPAARVWLSSLGTSTRTRWRTVKTP